MRRLRVLALLALAVGCAPKGPHWAHRCVAFHFVPIVHVVPVGAKGATMVETTLVYICDRYDSTWVVPDTTR